MIMQIAAGDVEAQFLRVGDNVSTYEPEATNDQYVFLMIHNSAEKHSAIVLYP